MFINTVLAEANTSEVVSTFSGTDIIGSFSINDIFTWAIGVGGMLALGIFIYAGILYIASAGNPSRQQDATEWIWAAVYGLLLLATGWIIINIINPAILK